MSVLRRSAEPVIGLSVELLEPPLYPGRRRFQLFTDYMDCVRASGGIPVLLPADAGPDEALRWLGLVDGILMTGGDDLDLRPLGGPAPGGGCKPIPSAKQALDLAVIQAACERGLPLLGVCLGMQELGLAYDAPYIQHLEIDVPHEKGRRHEVRPVSGTLLADVVGPEPVEVPCFHHQALGGPGARLAAAAWSEDGVLEAVERRGHPFALGVQWHPERAPESPASRALFSRFSAAARAYRQART